MRERRFLYLDLDSFFCCCEILRDRSLLTLPFAVGGSPDHRGVVSSASYPARRRGVRSAMSMRVALRLCPELRVISPHFADYQQRSTAVMDYLHTITDTCEQRSVDEAALDISALPQNSQDLANEIQMTIRHRFRLPCSLGIASSIRVSKIAVEWGKQHGVPGKVPQAITIVPPGTEATFIAPLPAAIMPGIGPKMAESLLASQIATLGDLAAWPMLDLQRRYGSYGLVLQRYAQGIDLAEIETSHQRKAISQEHTFSVDITDRATLLDQLARQATQVSDTLTAKGMYATVVKIKLRWEDFTTLTRQVTLAEPTAAAAQIQRAAVQLVDLAWDATRPVRLVGVGVSGLQTIRQLRLWEEGDISDALPAHHLAPMMAVTTG